MSLTQHARTSLQYMASMPQYGFLFHSSGTRFCPHNDPGRAQERVVAHQQQNSGRSRWIVCGAGSAIGGLSGIGMGTPGYWGITTLEIARGGLSFSLIAIAGSQVAIG